MGSAGADQFLLRDLLGRPFGLDAFEVFEVAADVMDAKFALAVRVCNVRALDEIFMDVLASLLLPLQPIRHAATPGPRLVGRRIAVLRFHLLNSSSPLIIAIGMPMF